MNVAVLVSVLGVAVLGACKKSPPADQAAPADKAATPPSPACTALIDRMKACPDAATSKMSDAERTEFFDHQREGCVLAFAAGDAPPTAKGRDSQDPAEVTAYAQAFTRRSAGCAEKQTACAAFTACTVAPVE